MSTSTECPVCAGQVSLGQDAIIDELLECGDCGTDLVVTSLAPPIVEEAPASDEDWGE